MDWRTVTQQTPARAVKTDGRKRRWHQHKVDRRSELVDGTLEAIRQRGSNVSMDEIAAEIGVSKTVLYRYFVDQHEYLHGPLDDAIADTVYQDAKRLGTTLQVQERMWPPDRVAFDEYWKRSLDDLHIDAPVREHLHGVASLAFLPWPLRVLAGPFNLFATTGFLAPEFRAMMQLDWSERQQRRFGWLLSALRLADRLIPQRAWILGYQLYLWDMRFRARCGWRIV